MVMLDLCRDAINATASMSDHRLEALDDAMRTLKILLQLHPTVAEVCLPDVAHRISLFPAVASSLVQGD